MIWTLPPTLARLASSENDPRDVSLIRRVPVIEVRQVSVLRSVASVIVRSPSTSVGQVAPVDPTLSDSASVELSEVDATVDVPVTSVDVVSPAVVLLVPGEDALEPSMVVSVLVSVAVPPVGVWEPVLAVSIGVAVEVPVAESLALSALDGRQARLETIAKTTNVHSWSVTREAPFVRTEPISGAGANNTSNRCGAKSGITRATVAGENFSSKGDSRASWGADALLII